jgi:hypothetical protein
MRAHIALGLRHTLAVLEPYFRLRRTSGKTFSRVQRQPVADLQDFKVAAEVE